MKAAFIGLGHMGGQQARQICRGGIELAVYDAYPPSLEAFQGLARLASSPADAARGADCVHICVRDDAQVNEVTFGPDGVVHGMAPGTLLLVHSTIDMDTVHALQTRLAEKGIALLDAPVSRVPVQGEGPFVFSMIGGDAADVERARPSLETFSTEILHVGECGSATALKICNNLVTWLQLMVGCQAQDIARHFGVPWDKLHQLMKSNGNLTPSMAGLLNGRHQAEAHGRKASNPPMVGIGEKDIALGIACGEAAGLDMDMARGARRLVQGIFGE